MIRKSVSRRDFLALSTVFATMMAACSNTQEDATETATDTSSDVASSGERETIKNDVSNAHAITVSAETAAYEAVDVFKTGDAEGDEADFYGTNAAVYAEEQGTLTLRDVYVETDGKHANAVFSYGEGTTIEIADSTIQTSNDCSGGVMVTGGGTLEGTNLSIHTTGNSSAAIRSDRGGGTQVVTGTAFITEGTGSPVIYSTADVTVSDATLESRASQGVVVEGKNSVSLVNCALTADNNTKNSDKSDFYQAVMIYQSMSGDAAEGKATFSMEGGSLTNVQGDIFFVNNTVADITLKGVNVTNNDPEGVLLRAAAAGWGNEGSNGGHVTMTMDGQTASGDIVVDEVSELNCYLTNDTDYTGAVNAEGTGKVYVEVQPGSTWMLTADSVVDALTCDADAITLDGFTLKVAGAAYEEGKASTGEAITFDVKTSTGGPGGKPGEGGEPPAKPGGEGTAPGGEPPAKPEGGMGGEPPAMPDGTEPPAMPEAETATVQE